MMIVIARKSILFLNPYLYFSISFTLTKFISQNFFSEMFQNKDEIEIIPIISLNIYTLYISIYKYIFLIYVL
jgi:hypothetical protein